MKNNIKYAVLLTLFVCVLSLSKSHAQMGGDSGGIVAFTANGPVIENITPQVSKKYRKKKIKEKDNPDEETPTDVVSEEETSGDNVKSTETVEMADGTKEVTVYENGSIKEEITNNDGSTMTINISADKNHRTSVYKKGKYTTEIETVVESTKKETKIISTAITTDANGKLIAETTKEKVLEN